MASTTIDTETELSAVNSILGAIGQSPITSISAGTANPDIRIKKNNGLMWARGYWAEYDTNYQTTQCHTLTTLAVNDYVQFHIGNTASVYDDDSYMYGFFVG